MTVRINNKVEESEKRKEDGEFTLPAPSFYAEPGSIAGVASVVFEMANGCQIKHAAVRTMGITDKNEKRKTTFHIPI